MAIRGQRPKPTLLRIVGGNAGKRPVREERAIVADDPPEKPPGMDPEPGALWDLFVKRAHWLTWADTHKAAMWCLLQAEFYASDGQMVAARIGQLRALGSELGFDPVSRDRMRLGGNPEKKADPSAEFFG